MVLCSYFKSFFTIEPQIRLKTNLLNVRRKNQDFMKTHSPQDDAILNFHLAKLMVMEKSGTPPSDPLRGLGGQTDRPSVFIYGGMV